MLISSSLFQPCPVHKHLHYSWLYIIAPDWQPGNDSSWLGAD
ncbi:unnamed protein product [Staurois parvus]|uniref:Uncharacterized protein n=1 Tax=Staurois parvus TaxID=386267 RepID=A0ABN9DLY5_9NEOB|nr:unnamed protein product [Staurois parvus]